MKKIISVLSILTIMLSSCSGDDSASQSNAVLVTKSKMTFEDGSTFESTFQYSGNKLVKIVHGSQGYSMVTYSGDLIVKIQRFENGALDLETNYQYENDRIINFKSVEYYDGNEYKEDVEYVYNADGTIGFTSQSSSSGQPTLTSTGLFNVNSFGEVISIVRPGGQTQTFTYDDKNSPFKNILGVDKLLFDGTYPNAYIHNVTSETDPYSTTTNTYTYNSNNYPLTISEDNGSEVINTTYSYNQ